MAIGRGASVAAHVRHLLRGLHVMTRPARLPIHVAVIGTEPNRVGKIVVTVEIRDGKAESIPAPFESYAKLHPIRVFPGIGRLHDARHAQARHAVGPTPEGQAADQVDRVGLTACTEIR